MDRVATGTSATYIWCTTGTAGRKGSAGKPRLLAGDGVSSTTEAAHLDIADALTSNDKGRAREKGSTDLVALPPCLRAAVPTRAHIALRSKWG